MMLFAVDFVSYRYICQSLRRRPPRPHGGTGADHARPAQGFLLRRPGSREDADRPPDRGHGRADRQAGL